MILTPGWGTRTGTGFAEGASECGHTVKTVADAGIIILRCTLDKGHEGMHFDSAFNREWR